MKAIPRSMKADELLRRLSSRIHQAVYRVSVGLALADSGVSKEDLSAIKVEEMLDKIRDFVSSDPKDEHYMVFLHYLLSYPVSMCRRNVSPTLRFLIGFHYRLGHIFKKDYGKANPVTMDELAEIFGRSKATIHDCIKETEGAWKDFLELKKKHEEAEAKAERELVEEAKERLRKENAAESQVLKK